MAIGQHITDQHKINISDLIMTWAKIEVQIIRGIQKALGINTEQAVITFWHMSHKERMTRLTTLLIHWKKDKNDKIRTEYTTLQKRIDTAYQVRNVFAHSLWGAGKKENSIRPLVVQAKGSDLKWTSDTDGGIPPEDYTAEDIKDETNKSDRLLADIILFFKKCDFK
jgi:hypothetical protein